MAQFKGAFGCAEHRVYISAHVTRKKEDDCVNGRDHECLTRCIDTILLITTIITPRANFSSPVEPSWITNHWPVNWWYTNQPGNR